MPKRLCPACQKVIPRGLLMCRGCWFAVPRKLRGDVGRRWKAFLCAEGAARLEALAAYRASAESAVAIAKGALP